MKEHKHRTGTSTSVSKGMLCGVGVAVTMVLAGSVLLAWLLASEVINWEISGYGIMGILSIAAFLGGIVACAMIKRKRIQMSVLFGVLFWGVLLGITMLLFGGNYEGVMVTGCLIMASSISAGLTSGEYGKGKRRKKIRTAHC